MAKNRKYDSIVEKTGSTWKAQIIRHITSKKTQVSKQKDTFISETQAQEWADEQLLEFASTLGASNKRHGEQRKLNEERRQQRSTRRAEKTKKAKLEILEHEQKLVLSEECSSDHS